MRIQLHKKTEENNKLRNANHELENKLETSVQHASQLDNVRKTLIERLNELGDYRHQERTRQSLHSHINSLEEENSVLREENDRYRNNDYLYTKQLNSVLENSGAFDDDGTDWEKLAKDRMVEIFRKEDVIRHKDDKATRLINIIRDKNNELDNLKWRLGETQKRELRLGNDFMNAWNELMCLKAHFGLTQPPSVQSGGPPIGPPGGQPGY